VFRDGQVASAIVGEDRNVVWVDRNGDETPIAGSQPKAYTMVRVSPDGTRMALEAVDGSGQRDLWTLDLQTGSLRQLTSNPEDDRHPVWSPASDRIYYASVRDGEQAIYTIPADGGEAEFVAGSSGFAPFPSSMSADGTTLAVLGVLGGGTNLDIYALSLDGDPQLTPLLTGPNVENEPEFSPDGNYIASTEVIDNLNQISIRPYPDVGRFRESVETGVASTAGIRHAAFSRDGASLFFFNGSGISEVAIDPGPPLSLGAPRNLFSRTYWYGVGGPSGATGRAWDWDSTRQRFALIKMASTADLPANGAPDALRINVVVDWFEELKARVR
jgi:dipeptidyl aminopeptidase/acylaminoacyl peptidase